MSTLTQKTKKTSNIALTDNGGTTTKTVNKDCIITNGAPVDVIVLDAYSDDTTPMQEIFQQTLKVLPPKDGTGIVKATATGTVTLDDQHKNDNGDTVDTTGYELIIAKADCLYPVKATHSTQVHNTTTDVYSYPGVTIAADAGADTDTTGTKHNDYANMQSAEKFLQNIKAYPSYDLAQDYLNACDKFLNAAATDDTDYIGNFFAGTVSYKKVTLPMVTAVTTYYEQFPYVWASYQGSKTYYLYTSDGTIVSYVGALQVKVATDVPAKTDKKLPGFTLTFTDPKDVETTMSYQKGKFVDTITEDIPGISLFGSFSLKSDLTNVPTDKGLISIIVGRVGSAKVIGFDEKQKETEVKDPNSGDTSKKWSGTYDLLHADNIGKVINLLMVAGGLFMTFKELYGGCKKINEWRLKRKAAKEAKGDDSPLSENDFVEIKSDQQRYANDQQIANRQEMAKVDPTVQVPKPEDMQALMENYSKQITERVNAEMKRTLQEGLDAQLDLYNKILDITHPKGLDAIKDRMDANQGKLDDATSPEACAQILPEVSKNLGQTNVDIQVDFSAAMKGADGGQKAGLNEAKTTAEEKGKVSENIDESRKRSEEETAPEDLDFPFKEYDPSIFE